ncbi:hypothetical protein F2P79_010029 [Pimephales promelas]|nr:hypothetical protein F2P79_010029 [Pimephales promelas]
MVHHVRGQCGTSEKEGIGEVDVQPQEGSPPVSSTDPASGTEPRSECHASRAAPNDSACECTVHKLVFELVRIDKCWICHSPLTSIKWHGVRCKQCSSVWREICLQKSSEDWDISDDDVSSGDEYIPASVSDSESSGTELSVELPGPSKKSHTTTNLPDLGVTFPEQDQTIDIEDNSRDICKNILMDLETTGDLQSDPEPESSESYLRKTKDASNEKGTVGVLGQSAPVPKKSSKDRKVLLEKFRNLGNFEPNSTVKTTGSVPNRAAALRLTITACTVRVCYPEPNFLGT